MFSDLHKLLPLMHKAHQQSVLRDYPLNEAIVQRNFVTALEFDSGYVKVVEKDGEVVGGLVGIISDNAMGIKCAQDMFCYSAGMTAQLIEDFCLWAKVRGAQFVHVTDLSANHRYHKLCRKLGFELGGFNFMRTI